MKIATFTQGAQPRIGVVRDDHIVDLSAVAGLATDMIGFLSSGPAGIDRARRAAAQSSTRLPLASVRLAAPVLNPRKFLALGGSYRSHVTTMGNLLAQAKHQSWFNKQVTCINGPYDDIHLPRLSHTLDYEGEIAIVIGRRGRHVKGSAAREMIAGFTICNDITVREWQLRSPTITLGKSFDTHGPLGPWIVTSDELPDVDDLWLKTWVNGELRQHGHTSDLVYTFGEMIEELSAVFTLEPGDVLSTGTPAGAGAAKQPPVYLEAGDVVRVEVEHIGYIENRVITEP